MTNVGILQDFINDPKNGAPVPLTEPAKPLTEEDIAWIRDQAIPKAIKRGPRKLSHKPFIFVIPASLSFPRKREPGRRVSTRQNDLLGAPTRAFQVSASAGMTIWFQMTGIRCKYATGEAS